VSSAECPAPIESWARACAASSGVDVELRACHADGFVVDVDSQDGATVLTIDIVRDRPDAFRHVGGISLTPMGEFADWSRESLARQGALDRVTECVRRSAPSIESLGPPDRAEPGKGVGEIPWLLLALIACALLRAAASSRCAGLRGLRRGSFRDGALMAGLSIATFALRWTLVPRAFFHQNGQGPDWIDVAWRGIQSAYGPGYAETYHWIATRSADAPEEAVFVANACVGAMIPALAYSLARLASSSRLVAGAIAALIAIAPIGARLAQSESYFVPMIWLLFVATLSLADAARFKVRSLRFAADVTIATLAIALDARIHPMAWVPAAVTPLVMMTTAPDLRTALRRTAAAAAVVGTGVSLLAGPTMWHVVRGSLGHSWMPVAGRAAVDVMSLLWVVAGAGLLALGWKTNTANRGLVALALLAIVVGIAEAADLVGQDSPAVRSAYAGLYAPVVVAAVARGAPRWLAPLLSASEARERACALAVVTLGVVLSLGSRRATSTLPTDARELSWVLGWRGSLPQSAIVYGYGHAGRRILYLPFYDGARMPRTVRLEDGPITLATRDAYYLRTSLCSTDEGREQCEQFERSHHLVPVHQQELPAIASLPSLPFSVSTVEVALYRIEP
jgi:hypothetical protein